MKSQNSTTGTASADVPRTLDYSNDVAPSKSALPTFAMAIGILSGPIAFGVTFVLARGFPPFLEGETLLTFAGLLILASLFALVIRLKLKLARRDRILAFIGIGAPIAWGLIAFLLIAYALSTVE